ncbi:MAG TPA: roadblock/LC7 domain-containing protein [Blastocatellia bacterium]|nr:roadblock/LC7 domain-containing protein [Blastocatellia bacterium]
MPFASLLKELVSSVDGADGAIFLESDGEAVQWFSKADGELLRLRAAYLSVMLRSYRAAAARLKLGNISSVILEYDGARFVIEELERGYVLILELGPGANVGQAIYRIQPAVASLRRELAA